MFTLFNLIVIIILGVPLYILSKLLSKPRIPKGLKSLPGPSGFPLVGNLFNVHEPLWSYLFKEGKKYGDIFKFTLGLREIVIINSNKILTKTLKEMGNNFSGRWQNIIVKTSDHDSGILFKDKEWWATQRSFVLKVLKDFGLGKERSNEIISQECSVLIKEIEESCGKVVSARYLFPKFMVNVISKLVMNTRFEREDKNFKLLTAIIEKTAQNNNSFIRLILMYPILERFPSFSHLLLKLVGRDQELSFIHNFVKEIIDEHKKHFNIENEGEDVIDMFLKEQYKLNQDNVKNHSFTDWQLIRVVFELFVAGYETTSTTLSWSLLILAKNPKVQDEVYKEIINVIGTERVPTIADKKSLSYTQAVMDEIFRFSSVVPLSLPHRVFESTEIEGFFIPKDSIVFPNLYACHRDKEIWEKPFDFYPEHFLNTQTNGDIKYRPRDELVSFSIGKRQCLGESLARVEFFVFLTSIVQRFRITFDKGMTEEKFSKMIRGTDGTIRAPLGSDVMFDIRQ